MVRAATIKTLQNDALRSLRILSPIGSSPSSGYILCHHSRRNNPASVHRLYSSAVFMNVDTGLTEKERFFLNSARVSNNHLTSSFKVDHIQIAKRSKLHLMAT
jgi:hypothetical protein